jgi:hypothetical protein
MTMAQSSSPGARKPPSSPLFLLIQREVGKRGPPLGSPPLGSPPKTSRTRTFLVLVVTITVLLSYIMESNYIHSVSSILYSSNEKHVVTRNPCRVVVENQFDFHYEIIESTAMLFPLPWNDMNCTLPAIVDVALPKLIEGAKDQKHRRLSGELPGYESYYLKQVQGSVVTRPGDNVDIQFGSLVDYENKTVSYHASIDTSCEWQGVTQGGNFADHQKWLEDNHRAYCVMHGVFKGEVWDSVRSQVCYLNPMYAPDFDYFIPSILPKFPMEKTKTGFINLCVSGKNRNHAMLAEALQHVQNVTVSIFGRPEELQLEAYNNVSHLLVPVQEPDFLSFQKQISECQIVLPLIDPSVNPNYFRIDIPDEKVGQKMLTGAVTQAIGYKIPTVSHVDLEEIYHDDWTAPVDVYNDTASFITALKRAIERVA